MSPSQFLGTLAFLSLVQSPASAGGVLINEVDSDHGFFGAGVDDRGFVELYDGGVGGVALDGLVVVLFRGDTDLSYAAFDLDGHATDAQGYFVLGGAAVPGVDLVVGGADILLDAHAGSHHAVALYEADAADFPAATPLALADLVDALVYGWGADTDPELLTLLTSGGAVPDNFHGAGASMSRCPDGAGGARATGSYAAVDASPGEPTPCPAATDFCNAFDGALAGCPCAPGLPNTGCDRPVSVMQGGGLTGGVRLQAVLQVTSPDNRATLTSAGFPASDTPTAVLMRATQLVAGAPPAFGDGVLCIGAPVVRIGAAVGFGGVITSTFGHGAMAGSGAFLYQSWYRETPMSYCDPAAAFSTSNGVELTW